MVSPDEQLDLGAVEDHILRSRVQELFDDLPAQLAGLRPHGAEAQLVISIR